MLAGIVKKKNIMDMQATHTAWYADLLQQQSPVPQLCARWQASFAAQLPPAACSAQGTALLHAGLGPFWPVGRETLLLDAAFAAPCTAQELEDFRPPAARVALLPPASLRRAALAAGAVCRRAELLRVMDNNGVTALRETLGEDARLFALRHGAAFAAHAALWHTALPEALHRWLAALPLPHSAAACGWLAILACASAGGRGILTRLRCLLAELEQSARAGGPAAPLDSLPDAATAGAWPLVRVIIRKTCPQPSEYTWEQLFA